MLRIRAFNAPDDMEAGEQFVRGHRKVLEDLGVKVTSSKSDWIDDPYVYVVVVEDTESKEVVGGTRLHVSHENGILPMEEAVGRVDPRIFNEIKKLRDDGTGEIAGIWNSRSVMGMGLGSIFVMRSIIALGEQIGLKTMLSFASKATRDRGYAKGFEPFVNIGNNGEFNYPKLDLIATAVICYDLKELPLAIEIERTEIFKLREKLNFKTIEQWPRGLFELEYQLKIESPQIVRR